MPNPAENKQPKNNNNLITLLKQYRAHIIGLTVLTIGASALNLVVPRIVAHAIDSYNNADFNLLNIVLLFSVVALFILVFTYLQSVLQTMTAELVARNLRTEVAAKISNQEYQYIQEVTPDKLLTNLTADVNAVKSFVSMAVTQLISSSFLVIGTSVMLLTIDWELALAVLLVVPIIGTTFFLVLRKVRKLFQKAQEAIDWLNKVINESILGSALIRLVNSQAEEYNKFIEANSSARDIGLGIVRIFAMLIPTIVFLINLATLLILMLGGHFVMKGDITLGSFTAFNSYLSILIFPILVMGFMSNVISQATASYGRIAQVLAMPDKKKTGGLTEPLRGAISVRDITMTYGQHSVLKDVSFEVRPGSRTAIIGPTAAGKTQLLYLLTGLLRPTAGTVQYDGHIINDFDAVHFHNQVGLVFQDSIIFNATLRENIAFNTKVNEDDLRKAIATAELSDFVDTLPDKLDTIISERGTSLSGGQKQRIMLARALSLNPTVLLLDDFTARVDNNTEKKILDNVRKNYPEITLISVTQKIGPIEEYDQIVVLMEGEVLALGKHGDLMESSPEYVQIYNSQQSTNAFEPT